ncbi:hypothetical protein T492DRAFT_842942 [Pavlovales sp. CCMP2436]|nr:hypothetical protein T492DRAFT_842942 [Pavlovales sp. CCMP2436]
MCGALLQVASPSQSPRPDPSGAWTIFVDGSSGAGSRTASGAGALLVDPCGEPVISCARFLCRAESCTAEYAALELGLRLAAPYTPAKLRVISDARVVIDCLRGEGVPRRMKGSHARVLEAAATLAAVEYVHVPRASNALADSLARQSIASASLLFSELLRAAAISQEVEQAARILRQARASGSAVSLEAWVGLIATCRQADGIESALRVADQASEALCPHIGAEQLLTASLDGAWKCPPLATSKDSLARALELLMSPTGVTSLDCMSPPNT